MERTAYTPPLIAIVRTALRDFRSTPHIVLGEMMKRSTLILLLILTEAILAVFVFAPATVINNKSHAQAFVAWRENPTPETEARWVEMNRKLSHETMVMDTIFIVALVLNTAAIVIVFKKRNKKHNQQMEPIA